MAFFKANRTEEAVKDRAESKVINKSGIYDINILAAFLSGDPKGSMVVDFYIDHEGKKQVLYGNLRLTNRDGSENFAAKYFNQLLVIADIEEVEDSVDGELPIGKEGALKDVALLEDLSDIECKVKIIMEYGIYQGSITEKKVIRGFYNTDGFTAEEILKGVEKPEQIEKDKNYVKDVYKDGLTKEVVEAWIANGRKKGDIPGGASKAEKTKPSFGAKKFGAK